MSFRLRDHTADVAVEARGESLDDVFAAVAAGLTAAQCDDVPPASGREGPDGGERKAADADDQTAPGAPHRYPVAAHAESREALLFEYLDELIYQRDVREVLPADHEVQVDWRGEWVASGTYRGVPFDRIDAREVKAVTYSEMRLEETEDGWDAYVVFDV